MNKELQCWAGGVAELVECWANKHEALCSIPSTTQTGCKPIIPERDNLQGERQGSQRFKVIFSYIRGSF